MSAATSPKRHAALYAGGYEEDRFEKPVPLHFKCPICLDVFRSVRIALLEIFMVALT